MKEGIGKTHGKIILMGEHAVVYGQPCIALPFFDTMVKTVITPYKTQRLTCEFYDGLLETMPELMEGLQRVIFATLDTLGERHTPLHLDITSTIPIERGMGSSAAVAGSVVRALFDYFDQPLDYNQLLALINVSETITHGSPSGIDALTTTGTEPVYFIKHHAPKPIDSHLDATLVVADTGVLGKTKEAVGYIRRHYEEKDVKKAIEALGDYTKQAKQALLNQDAQTLGTLMNQAHHLLQFLHVSSNELDVLVQVARENGALGSKLTGGGRGGCMIALCRNQDADAIMNALKEHDATHVWKMALEGE